MQLISQYLQKNAMLRKRVKSEEITKLFKETYQLQQQ